LILCIGIGNTNIRCAVGTKDNYNHAVEFMAEVTTSRDFIGFMETSFGANIWGKLQGCIISSVVPVMNNIVVEALHDKNNSLSIQYLDMITSNIDFSGYKSKLGDDRFACCVAAAEKHGFPAIIIDMGTATTINVINEVNKFIGGAILTGVETGLAALTKKTAQLPPINDFSNVKIIGQDTRECLVSGAVVGTVCMLEGYIKRIKDELRADPIVVITGGNAQKVMKFCNFDYIYEPSLLLEGLFISWACKNLL